MKNGTVGSPGNTSCTVSAIAAADASDVLAAGATVTDIRNQIRSGDSSRADVVLTMQAQRGSSSWIYAATALRAGASILVQTPRYQVQGTVLRVTPDWTLPASPQTVTNGPGNE